MTDLADLVASRSALIFSALLRGLSARLSYVTLRRLSAGSLSAGGNGGVGVPLSCAVALGGDATGWWP